MAGVWATLHVAWRGWPLATFILVLTVASDLPLALLVPIPAAACRSAKTRHSQQAPAS